MKKTFGSLLSMSILAMALFSGLALFAQQKSTTDTTASTDQPFVIEYYYKVKWGHRTSSSPCSKRTICRFCRKKCRWGACSP